jgi:hypothetical protein
MGDGEKKKKLHREAQRINRERRNPPLTPPGRGFSYQGRSYKEMNLCGSLCSSEFTLCNDFFRININA